MPLNNPEGYLTKVLTGGSSSDGIPSISNTKSSPTIARFIDRDLDYLKSLGPGPMPWEEPSNAFNPKLGPPLKPLQGPG